MKSFSNGLFRYTTNLKETEIDPKILQLRNHTATILQILLDSVPSVKSPTSHLLHSTAPVHSNEPVKTLTPTIANPNSLHNSSFVTCFSASRSKASANEWATRTQRSNPCAAASYPKATFNPQVFSAVETLPWQKNKIFITDILMILYFLFGRFKKYEGS